MFTSFKTWFGGEWSKFINWFGSKEAAVVAELKPIIDNLVPLLETDALADGSELLTAGAAALGSGTGLAGIAAAAAAMIPVALKQGVTLSEEGATALAAALSAKAKATSSASGTAGTVAGTTAN